MKTKFFFTILYLFLLIISVNAKYNVVCTITPYTLITKDIVKDKIDVITILPQNASPHTYSPKPSDIIKMKKANLLIANGLNLDKLFINKAKSENINMLIIGNTLKKYGINENSNVHIWLSLEFINTIIDTILYSIVDIDTINKNFYIKNAETLKKDIKDFLLKAEIQRDSIKINSIVVYHNAFYYFLKDLNINVVGIFEKHPGKEITPKELEELVKTIEEYKLPVIFTEPNINNKSVNIVKNTLKLKVGMLDPLGNYSKVNSICDLYKYNWRVILEGYSDTD